MMYQYLLLLSLLLQIVVDAGVIHCKEPDAGGQGKGKISKRKFLVIGGVGAGLGNFLIFYPAAYYFAALTGRDILIDDNSLIGEMCKVLICGFPHVSQLAASYPAVFDVKIKNIRGIKTVDMHGILQGKTVLDDQILIAHGYKYQSGWYSGYNHTDDCIDHLTGCDKGDISCQH